MRSFGTDRHNAENYGSAKLLQNSSGTVIYAAKLHVFSRKASMPCCFKNLISTPGLSQAQTPARTGRRRPSRFCRTPRSKAGQSHIPNWQIQHFFRCPDHRCDCPAISHRLIGRVPPRWQACMSSFASMSLCFAPKSFAKLPEHRFIQLHDHRCAAASPGIAEQSETCQSAPQIRANTRKRGIAYDASRRHRIAQHFRGARPTQRLGHPQD